MLTKSNDLADGLIFLKMLKIHFDSLQYNVAFLSEKSILLQDIIPRIINDQIRQRLNFLKLWMPSNQQDLNELLHNFDCRYKSKFFQENLREAEAVFFLRLKQTGSIHHICNGKLYL